MKYTVIAIIVAVWLWSYYRVIRWSNRFLHDEYGLQVDIEQLAPPTGRLRALIVAPAIYAKIVFRTLKDAIVCGYALFLVWWYDRKSKKEDAEW